ncbi:hypothetical protein KKI93_24155, partial [Xenorhabdus bovienii]|uniref:hypothetical protein n=1 Tax=Xenorhabdus bovienii TaxID=40576 RepID=UPI0023B33A46
VWGNGFFAKTMIPDHHTVQIPLIKRQQPLVTNEYSSIGIFRTRFQIDSYVDRHRIGIGRILR